jgi:hypothetical protein
MCFRKLWALVSRLRGDEHSDKLCYADAATSASKDGVNIRSETSHHDGQLGMKDAWSP